MEEQKKKLYTPAQKKAIYKYRETHKDVQAAVYARWKIKNAERVKEYSKNYYQKNKEKILQSRKEHYKSKSESESSSTNL
jgi:starvation-inducible outer membrane lipoprotein